MASVNGIAPTVLLSTVLGRVGDKLSYFLAPIYFSGSSNSEKEPEIPMILPYGKS